jgi:hypothetical protein
MKPQPPVAFDKLYWLRIGLAAFSGFVAEVVGSDIYSGISLGIAVYLISYYAARFAWFKGIDKMALGKVYSTGWGGYIMVFLFTWILFFTIRTAGYPL